MADPWILYACLFLALWSAIVGGVFSAFSEFIMKALLNAPPAAGISAMQNINITVIKTQFVVGIFVISVLSAVLAVYGAVTVSGPVRMALVAAAFTYIPCVFLTTMFANVPMNNRLAALDCESAEAHAYWRIYGRDWARYNHIRAIGSVLTALFYLYAALALSAL